MLEKKGPKGELASILKNLRGEEVYSDLGDRAHEAHEMTVRTTVASIRSLNFREAEAEEGAALNRIVSGTYGICEECGEPISDARLWARPNASKCITCEKKKELSRPKGFRIGF